MLQALVLNSVSFFSIYLFMYFFGCTHFLKGGQNHISVWIGHGPELTRMCKRTIITHQQNPIALYIMVFLTAIFPSISTENLETEQTEFCTENSEVKRLDEMLSSCVYKCFLLFCRGECVIRCRRRPLIHTVKASINLQVGKPSCSHGRVKLWAYFITDI